jgi:DNA-binding protein H-NS
LVLLLPKCSGANPRICVSETGHRGLVTGRFYRQRYPQATTQDLMF